jgi:hypothetical protein
MKTHPSLGFQKRYDLPGSQRRTFRSSATKLFKTFAAFARFGSFDVPILGTPSAKLARPAPTAALITTTAPAAYTPHLLTMTSLRAKRPSIAPPGYSLPQNAYQNLGMLSP